MLGSAAAIVMSIAVSQILLGLALIALLASEAPLRFPPIKAPLLLFLGWTMLSILLSGHPAAGLPQVRKLFVFTVLLVTFSVLREARQARWLAEAWFVVAAASAVRSLVQFGQKLEMAHASGEDFYDFYVGERITGFLSHWMTFSEVGLMVLLVLLSYLFFAPKVSRRAAFLGGLCVALLVGSLLVSFTRSIWLAAAIACGYLVWQWRKKFLLVAPVALAVAFAAGPGAFQRRIGSMLSSRSDNSTSARIIMWRTGWRMIRAHPWFGVGPERIGPEFARFQPPDVTALPEAFYGHLHNLYIDYAAERGVPAALALVWLFGRVLRDHWKALRGSSGENRFILQSVVAAMIGLILGGFFELNLGDSEVLTVFLTLVSLGYAAIERQKAEALACMGNPL